MICNIGSLLARYTALSALVLGPCLSSAFAEQVEHDATSSDVSELASRPMGKALTDFEKMELYHRRYSNAANSMAQLFKQLNQKIQEVSLAAKTAEAKDNSHNRRQLEDKLRQLERAHASYSNQYSQLQSQMQNEYRNYAALINSLKVKYNALKDAKNREEAAEIDKSAKAESARAKESKVKGSKAKLAKAKEPAAEDLQLKDIPVKDPRVMDIDTKELRARRDGTSGSNPDPGPTLNIVQ